jgi:hypothetical protein
MYIREDIVWFQKFNRSETDKITCAYVTGNNLVFGGLLIKQLPSKVFFHTFFLSSIVSHSPCVISLTRKSHSGFRDYDGAWLLSGVTAVIIPGESIYGIDIHHPVGY